MRNASLPCIDRIWPLAVVIATIAQGLVQAEQFGGKGDRDHGQPVYQRHAFEWMGKHGHGHKWRNGQAPQVVAPPVSSGWFQRPYPYHLDYYKMRYGGSYAPYFGNLYGPPQVVTAPPYYGPYYGGYEFGYPGAHGPNGQHPGFSNGVVYEAPVEKSAPQDSAAAPPNSDSLPAP